MRGTRAKRLRRIALKQTPPAMRGKGQRTIGQTVVSGGVRGLYQTLKKAWKRRAL